MQAQRNKLIHRVVFLVICNKRTKLRGHGNIALKHHRDDGGEGAAGNYTQLYTGGSYEATHTHTPVGTTSCDFGGRQKTHLKLGLGFPDFGESRKIF